MGMLTEAKKDEKKKHPAAASAKPSEKEMPAEGGDEDEGAADQGAPDAEADEPQGDGDDDDAGAAQPPQGAEDAQSQTGAPAGQDADQAGGEDDAGQSGAPGGEDGDTAPGQGGSQEPQGGALDLSKVPISPALKEEYIRCNGALYTALYKNDKVAQAVIKGIVPQGPHKIESVARMSLLLFTQINKQLHFVKDTPQVVLPFARDITEHVLDLATTVAKIQFSDQEAQAAIGTMLELVQRVVGVTKGNIAALRHVIPRSQLQDAHSKYQQHLQYIKGARDASAGPGAPQSPANPGGQTPQGQPDQSQGQPDQSQAQPPGGQPQAGAPDTAAPGPGQSAPPGGMLAQAAAQPPQGG